MAYLLPDIMIRSRWIKRAWYETRIELKIRDKYIGIEVLTAVVMKSSIF
jgi:hypothetical protein